jgi:hypothetical protein
MKRVDFFAFDPMGTQTVQKMVDALCYVNVTQSKTAAKTALSEKAHAFFKSHNVKSVTHGSIAVEMALPGSDTDIVLTFPFQPCEDVVSLLHQFAAEMKAFIDPTIKTPGNLVRMMIGDEQCDLFCVWDRVEEDAVYSINSLISGCDFFAEQHIPVEIRKGVPCSSFIPDLHDLLLDILFEIKASYPSYAAFILTKMAVKTTLSSTTVACLVKMSNYNATSPFVVMQKMLVYMNAIEDMYTGRVTPEMDSAISKLGRYNREDGSIYILAECQIKQVIHAKPDFVKFLQDMSIIDGASMSIPIGAKHPIKHKLLTVCEKLADLFIDPVTEDFKVRARKIACNY